MNTPSKRTLLILLGLHFLIFHFCLGQFQSTITIYKNGLEGLIDVSGKTIFPPEYEKIDVISFEGRTIYALQKNSKAWLEDLNGKRIMDPVNAPLRYSFSDWITYYQNNQYHAFHIPSRKVLQKGFHYCILQTHLATMNADSVWTIYFSPDSSRTLFKAERVAPIDRDYFVYQKHGKQFTQFYCPDIEFKGYINLSNRYVFLSLMILEEIIYEDEFYLYAPQACTLLGPFLSYSCYPSALITKEKEGFKAYHPNLTLISNEYAEDAWEAYNWFGLFNGQTWQIFDSTFSTFSQGIFTEVQQGNDGLDYFTGPDSTLILFQNGDHLYLSGKYLLGNHNDSLIAYAQGGKWGVMKADGSILTPAQYDEITLLGSQIFSAEQASETKIFHIENGKISTRKKLTILPEESPYPERNLIIGQPDWDWDRPISVRKGWFWDTKVRKWGLKDPQTQKILIPPTYEEVMVVPGDKLSVIFDGEWGEDIGMGIYNHTTQKVDVPPNGSNFDWQTLAITGKTRYVDQNWIWHIYEMGRPIKSFSGVSYIQPSSTGNYILQWGGSREKLDSIQINWEEKYFQEFVRGVLYKFDGGKFELESWNHPNDQEHSYSFLQETVDGYFIYLKSEEYGLIDQSNQRILKGFASLYLYDTLLQGSKPFNKVVLYDNTGKLLTPEPLDKIEAYNEGLAPAKKEGKWGYLDTLGRWAIPPKYDFALQFASGRGCVGQENNTFIVDRTGKVIFKLYGKPLHPFGDGWIPKYDVVGFCYYDINGNKMNIPNVKSASRFENGLAIVQTGEGYMVVTAKGKLVDMPPAPKMDWAEGMGIVAQYAGDWAWISPEGKFTSLPNATKLLKGTPTSCFYQTDAGIYCVVEGGSKPRKLDIEKIKPFSEGKAPAKQGDKWGYLDEKGNWAIPPQFYWAEGFVGSRAAVNSEGRYWVIDANGKPGPLPPTSKCPQMGKESYMYGNEYEFVLVYPNGSMSCANYTYGKPYSLSNGNWLHKNEENCKVTGKNGETLRTFTQFYEPTIYPHGFTFPVYYFQSLHYRDGREIANTWESYFMSGNRGTKFIKKGETAIRRMNGEWLRPPKP